jgi:putative transposase
MIAMVDWPHAPIHRIGAPGAYFITTGTYQKEPFVRGAARLDFLRDLLFEKARSFELQLQAWALFPNHYHFIVTTSVDASPLRTMITALHKESALHLNHLDGTPGRQVWFQFWDKHLTYERSYRARLNYVHENAVHHGIVARSENYAWCSARWFRDSVSRAHYESLRRVRTDRLKVPDDF